MAGQWIAVDNPAYTDLYANNHFSKMRHQAIAEDPVFVVRRKLRKYLLVIRRSP